MREVETLLVGATAYAVGVATVNKDCMIVEEGQWACSDFSAALNAEPAEYRSLRTTAAKTLANDLLSRGLLDGAGRIHILPVAAKLGEVLLQSGVPVWLDATLIGVKKKDDGFEATVFHRNGFEEILAKRVIDTRVCACLEGAKKFFCTAITAVEVKACLPDAKLLKGALGETVLKLYLEADDDYRSARRKTEAFILENLKGAKIYAFANAFGYEYGGVCEKNSTTGIRLVPSLSFGNVLSAYDGGVAAGVENESNRI